MSEHTPGPWEWEYHPDSFKPIALVADGSDLLLVTGDGDGRGWAEVSDADARLVAAAPDLLEACRAALDAVDYLQGLWGKEAVTDRVAGRLRAAIARATTEAAHAD